MCTACRQFRESERSRVSDVTGRSGFARAAGGPAPQAQPLLPRDLMCSIPTAERPSSRPDCRVQREWGTHAQIAPRHDYFARCNPHSIPHIVSSNGRVCPNTRPIVPSSSPFSCWCISHAHAHGSTDSAKPKLISATLCAPARASVNIPPRRTAHATCKALGAERSPPLASPLKDVVPLTAAVV